MTHQLARPFIVIATQNPVDMEGTYALPEAQRDRFMAQISLGYPIRPADELRMLAEPRRRRPARARCGPACSHAELDALMAAVASRPRLRAGAQPGGRHLARDPDLSDQLRLGASPRATLHLVRAGRAWAALEGRTFVRARRPAAARSRPCWGIACCWQLRPRPPAAPVRTWSRTCSGGCGATPGAEMSVRRLRRPAVLTFRGTLFLALGAGLVAAGILGALAPAAMFGVLIGLLPITALLLTRGEAAAVSLQRDLSVAEVATGGILDVTLTVRGRLARGRSLLLEDVAPPPCRARIGLRCAAWADARSAPRSTGSSRRVAASTGSARCACTPSIRSGWHIASTR